MIQTPGMTLSGIVLDSPDAQVLAAFYRRLLGWKVKQDEPDRVKLSTPGVADLDAAGAHAVAAGAVLAEYQPPDHVGVYLDPATAPTLPVPA